MAGCDEGYLDITEYCLLNSLEPGDCVSKIRQEVFEATQLTVSAGIAPNMARSKWFTIAISANVHLRCWRRSARTRTNPTASSIYRSNPRQFASS